MRAPIELELATWFDSLPAFEEDAPTFAENALGKALHYSRSRDGFVFADDSGLVVPALGGAPGVLSARYAGPRATARSEMRNCSRNCAGKTGSERSAYFVCVIALVAAREGDGHCHRPRGWGDSGGAEGGRRISATIQYFYFPDLGKAFAELSAEEKNDHSHRAKAFRRLASLDRS